MALKLLNGTNQTRKNGKASGKTKRQNQHKLRVINNVKNILDRITISNIFVPQDKENGWGNSAVYQNGKPIRVTPTLAWHLDNIRAKWEVMCGLFCRNQQGEHYIQYYVFQADRECLNTDIADQAQQICAYLFHNGSKLQKLAPFFLASPRTNEDREIDIMLAIHTAHIHKVFNRLATNFEINCNMPFKDYHSGNWFEIPINYDKFEFVDVPLEEALQIRLKYMENQDGTTTIEPTTEQE